MNGGQMTGTQFNKIINEIAESKKKEHLYTKIPDDLQTFYDQMGHFIHPKTKQEVTTLADYQRAFWDDTRKTGLDVLAEYEEFKAAHTTAKQRGTKKYQQKDMEYRQRLEQIAHDTETKPRFRLYLKSQKIGLSMMCIMECVHVALTYGRGMEILIISQTVDKAKEHLRDLILMVKRSKLYSPYLIEDGINMKDMLKTQKTKVDEVWLMNPTSKERGDATRIKALGITSLGSLVSFKKVVHIHMSDITVARATDEVLDDAFKACRTRLINTQGTMVVECPPRGTSGPIWNICHERRFMTDGYKLSIPETGVVTEREWLVKKLPYTVALRAGLMTEKDIETERINFGVLFGMYYEADFYSSDRAWFTNDMLMNKTQNATTVYTLFNS